MIIFNKNEEGKYQMEIWGSAKLIEQWEQALKEYQKHIEHKMRFEELQKKRKSRIRRAIRYIKITLKGRRKLLLNVSDFIEGSSFYFAYYGRKPKNMAEIKSFYRKRIEECQTLK